MDAQQEVVVRTVSLSRAVSTVADRQKLSPIATQAVGEALVCAVLLGGGLKDEGEQLQLMVRGDGPLGSIIAIADRQGICRGRVSHGAPSPPPSSVAKGIGEGLLHVVRNNPSRGGRPYNASVPLPAGGSIAAALEHYMVASEQRPALFAAACTVPLDAAASPPPLLRAQGYLVEFLPGASDATRAALAAAHAMLAAQLTSTPVSAADAAALLLKEGGGGGATLLSRASPAFRCTCSHERSAGAVRMLGTEELRSAVAEARNLEVRCEFCGAVYAITPRELEAMLEPGGGGGGSGAR
ncbi:heat shock protein Hsp33 [Tribonema minus]|uniref:Heat shock protein Hsp33 n=1 Tax=Tribonema minus TaxID=303371 RepID=A0A836C6I6_9STRA|nr:heat shock protein Hsp33 [Tribonema minus]